MNGINSKNKSDVRVGIIQIFRGQPKVSVRGKNSFSVPAEKHNKI